MQEIILIAGKIANKWINTADKKVQINRRQDLKRRTKGENQ